MQFPDQLGNTIRLPAYPKRIISLAPPLTELLFHIELDDEIVGVTSYCVLPKEIVANKPKIGGTKQFDFELIDKLKPDLIIGNKEENYREGVFRLQEKYAIWMSDVTSLEDALQMIKSVGKLVNRLGNAERLVDEIKIGLDHLMFYRPLKVAYLIWKNPYMVAAGNTFIDDMLRRCGFINIFKSKNKYPTITLDELVEADVILLSSEPYPFGAKDIEDFKKRYSTQRVCLVDGAMFASYGSRLRYAASYYKRLHELL